MTEMQPKRSFHSTLSNDARRKLRDQVAALRNSRRKELDWLNGAYDVGAGGAANAPKAQRKKLSQNTIGPNGGI
jgi:hypothetical protein